MPHWLIVTLCSVGILILVGIWFVATYNSLVRLRNRVSNAWAQIDVQLQRRLDLIPNLVNTVKGYIKHESETLQKVVSARNAVMNANGVEAAQNANDVLSGALKTLFAVSESYPDLKANTNFLELQAELANTEDKISYMRLSYNDVVMAYNSKVQSIPSNIVAKLAGFQLVNHFDAKEEADRPATVEF